MAKVAEKGSAAKAQVEAEQAESGSWGKSGGSFFFLKGKFGGLVAWLVFFACVFVVGVFESLQCLRGVNFSRRNKQVY